MGKREYLDLDPALNEQKIKIISPPDTDEFKKYWKNKFKREFNIPESKKIIGAFLEGHYIKGVDFLVKDLKLINNLDKDYILCLIGSDDGYLQETKRLLKIEENVKFIGFCLVIKKMMLCMTLI